MSASKESALWISDVVVHFGGVTAVDAVSLQLFQGEILGLIGPNGAGKTTLMDCISGHRRPEGGRIFAFDRDLTGYPPEFRAHMGLYRSFQDARLFSTLTVHETLVVYQERHRPSALFGSLLRWPITVRRTKEKERRADQLIERIGLAAWRDVATAELSTGTRRVCEIACMLLARPRVLLLDEPTAGIAQKETEALGPLISHVRDELGCSIILIEHDMPTIFALSDRVIALSSGRIIAEGPPDRVRRHPDVIASYLGTSQGVIRRSGRRADRRH
jgi:ABC-type branched-subunit amino acid transport system ATPase component